MKRYISLALCALAFIGLGSCNKVNETDFAGGPHSVTFRAQMGGDTRTGLALKFVPNWLETDIDNVHLFETYNGEVTEGEEVKMQTPVDGSYEIAYFTADYGQMTIIVNPPSQAPAATRADAGGFTYGGIVAQRDNSNKYFVPATQTPQASTLIDPDADFLVGHSLQSFPMEQSDKQVNLKFIRPVAISRLSIMNLEGTKVLSVKITSADALVGTAAYDDINFEDGTVAFTGGSKVLTLDYETGVAIPAEGIFDAYFVSLTGAKKILAIDVKTDAGTYTKDLGDGKTLTFKVPDFKSIAVNMAGSGSGEPSTDLPQNIKFVRDGSDIGDTDSFDMYTDGNYVSPSVSGAAPGATLTYNSSDTGVATVTNGIVTPVGVGETTISVRAGAVTGYQAGYAEYTLTVTDSTPEPVLQSLAFVKNGNPITEDSFDLASGGTYVKPSLTGVAQGATVTYAISCIPDGVATINTSTGDVTPVAEGVAIITATASAVTGYLETSKSYTLTITNSTTPEPPVAEATYNYVSGNLSKGTYLIVSYDNNADPVNAVALFPNVVEKSWGGSSPANPGTCITEKEITLDGNNPIKTTDAEIVGAEVELIASGSGWKVKAKKTGEYLVSPTSSNINHVFFSENEADGSVFSAGNVSGNGRSFTVSGTSNLYFFHSGSANGFTIRSGNSPVSNLRFYKRAKKTQTLAFVGTSAEFDLADGGSWITDVPGLDRSGAETEVTYGSSNTAVAEVNSSTGAVTIPSTAKKGNTAVITATAAETDEYEAATAQYTIYILDSTPGVTTTYEKVTSTSGIVAGKSYLIVYENGASSKVFKPILNGNTYTESAANAIDAVVSNNTISSDALEDCLVTLEAASGSNFYMKAAGSYLYPSSGNIGAETSPTSSRALSISISNGKVIIKRSEYSHYLAYDSYFLRAGSNSGNLALYTLSDGTTPEPPTPVAQTPSFSPNSVSGKVGETKTAPTLSGAMTPVSYSNSNAAVVEFNSVTGILTLKAEGSATITAIAEAATVDGVTYAEGTASFTVTVSPADPVQTSTYKRISYADGITTGKYLIVNPADAYVFTTSTGTTNAEAVTPASGVLSGDYTAYELTITKNGDNYTIQNSSNQYLYYNYSQGNQRVGYQTNVNNWTINSVSADAYAFRFTSSSQNIYWNSTYFRIGGSGTDGVHLYKLDDGGTTPEPPTPSTVSYTKVDAVTSGATYLIVSHTDALALVGNGNTSNNNTNFISVSPSAGVISGTASDFENCEAVITEESSGSYSIYFTKQKQYFYYLNSQSGLGYEGNHDASHDFELSTVTSGDYAGSFLFTKSSRYLYYNDTFFKIGGSGSKLGVHLYKKN